MLTEAQVSNRTFLVQANSVRTLPRDTSSLASSLAKGAPKKCGSTPAVKCSDHGYSIAPISRSAAQTVIGCTVDINVAMQFLKQAATVRSRCIQTAFLTRTARTARL